MEKVGGADMIEYSIDLVQLPLKTPHNRAIEKNESVHTFVVDVVGGSLKSSYEMAHDAKIHQMSTVRFPSKVSI